MVVWIEGLIDSATRHSTRQWQRNTCQSGGILRQISFQKATDPTGQE